MVREGRGISRFKLHSAAKYKRVYRVGGESTLKDGMTKEIGLKDAILEIKEDLPVGVRVYMEIKLLGGYTVKTEGIISQSTPVEDDFYEIEVKFTGLSPKDRIAINTLGYRSWIQQEEQTPFMRNMRTPYEPEEKKKE